MPKKERKPIKKKYLHFGPYKGTLLRGLGSTYRDYPQTAETIKQDYKDKGLTIF